MPSDFTSLSGVEAYLRERLVEPLPGADAQRRFAPRPPRHGWRPDDQPPHARRAAALILLYPGPEGPSVPLTLRHSDLPLHPGQVSLPGGGVDAGESPEAAAVREAHEELGIAPETVRLIGGLSPLWVIVSNFVVQAFVGIADARPDFRPAPNEVEALLEVPLADLRDVARLKWGRRTREGLAIQFPYFELAGQEVWGATAMLLGEFAALFDPNFGPSPTSAE